MLLWDFGSEKLVVRPTGPMARASDFYHLWLIWGLRVRVPRGVFLFGCRRLAFTDATLELERLDGSSNDRGQDGPDVGFSRRGHSEETLQGVRLDRGRRERALCTFFAASRRHSMFALPKKLSSSLGIIGDDPKLAFRTQASGIRRMIDVRVGEISPSCDSDRLPLLAQNIPSTDDRYWSQVLAIS